MKKINCIYSFNSFIRIKNTGRVVYYFDSWYTSFWPSKKLRENGFEFIASIKKK